MKVIVCGSSLAGDDGVGARIINLLDSKLTEGVETINVGTDSLKLLEELKCSEKVIILDSFITGADPGTVYRLTPQEITFENNKVFSSHGIDIAHVLNLKDVLYPEKQPKIVIIGVEAADTSPYNSELTKEVQNALPEAVKKLEDEIKKACD